ncbi:glycine cleavage system protein R [Oceanisphaera ostreae]|uniref:Glycine cleavage system transcriptional repressor n=1 Tax=Oceanisphaera ostreae TaxID=914151 RepID=A0ABW3KIA4_9GAMM
MKTLVATIIGPDKAGLVKQLATLIKQHHGSWQASAMSELAGYFAGIIEISVPQEHSQALSDALQQLPDFQIQLLDAKQSAQAGQKLALTVTANDRIGIIDEVTEVLNQLNISVNTLKTDSYSAPTTGTMLFEAKSMLTLPHDQTLHNLKEKLEALSDDLVVDIDLIATL